MQISHSYTKFFWLERNLKKYAATLTQMSITCNSRDKCKQDTWQHHQNYITKKKVFTPFVSKISSTREKPIFLFNMSILSLTSVFWLFVSVHNVSILYYTILFGQMFFTVIYSCKLNQKMDKPSMMSLTVDPVEIQWAQQFITVLS